ncbi:MAG: cupin domain-containing protein [Deltaproteobacteria bacterium]|nr:cupin domain-containing protein [Deltaproteobacteria bacterium]
MPNVTVEDLINRYDLKPHPEGGYYQETYRAEGTIAEEALPKNFKGDRNWSTAIYFLLPEGAKSKLHRLAADEVFHFYLGGPLTIAQIFPDGKVEKTVLGPDVKAGHKPQHVVPAGCWFGATPNPGSRFSFIGTTVAPGFDFADFELGSRLELLKQFPKAKEIIELLGH